MRYLLYGVAALALAGCEHDAFLLEITPQPPGGFRRELTAWHVGASGEDGQKTIRALGEEQLRGLEEIYGPGQPIEDGKKHRFSGSFGHQTPTDFDGHGSLLQYDSPLGSLGIYSERFRGSADLEAELTRRRAAADQLVDLVTGWLRSELQDEPEWAAIEKFLDGQFREDLKNLAVYAWTSEVAEQFQADSQLEFGFRAWQYLGERDYVRPAELPQLARSVARAEEQPEVLLGVVQRALARQIGIGDDQPVPASLAWLGDPQRVQRSLEQYLRQSEFYRVQQAEWWKQHPDKAETDAPDPDDLLGELVFGQMLGIRLGTVDRLEVRLHCGRQPLHSNGKWDPETGRVTWEHELVSNRSLPAFSYAVWCAPGAEFQTAHFGRVLLDGEQLAEYVLWHQGLSAQEADVWNQFLQECRPGQRLHDRISGFRFSPADQTAEEQAAAGLAETPRRLLLEALGEEQTP